MMSLDGFWHSVGHQLRCPTGHWGQLTGRLMAIANREPNRIAIDALDVRPGDTVLELGFGPGIGVMALSRLASRGAVLGIDHSSEMVSQALQNNKSAVAEGRVSLKHGVFEALPWEDEIIDKILAVNVIYFFGKDGQAIREARRVLRPGGAMAIYATDRSTMSKWKFSGPETHSLIGEEELHDLLRSGGFEPVEIAVRRVSLPFAIEGLLAVVEKRGDAQAPHSRMPEQKPTNSSCLSKLVT
jgi:SAM-dependent methyltransferase